jgi:hypothetical protein
MGMTRKTMKDRCVYVFFWKVVFDMKEMGRKFVRLGKSKKRCVSSKR